MLSTWTGLHEATRSVRSGGASSRVIEGLDRDLTKESCKMMHGNVEEAQLSVAELRELEAQNSKSSLFSTDLQTQNSFGSLTKQKGWFDFKAKADKVKEASPASSSKTVCKKIEQDWVDEQCKSRNDSKMCKRSKSLIDIKTGLVSDLELGSGVKEDCKFSCSGPVDKQPAICGFNAAFNYLMNDAAVTVSDDCVAYSSGSGGSGVGGVIKKTKGGMAWTIPKDD